MLSVLNPPIETFFSHHEFKRRRDYIDYFFEKNSFLNQGKVSKYEVEKILISYRLLTLDISKPENIQQFIQDEARRLNPASLRSKIRISLSAAFAFLLRGIISDEEALRNRANILNKYQSVFQEQKFPYEEVDLNLIIYIMYMESLANIVKPVVFNIHYAAVLLENHAERKYLLGGKNLGSQTKIRKALTEFVLINNSNVFLLRAINGLI